MAKQAAVQKISNAVANNPDKPWWEEEGAEGAPNGERIDRPDVDGWYKPEVGLVFVGKLVGSFPVLDKKTNQVRQVALVKLYKPCKAYHVGNETPFNLKADQVLAVGVRFKLQDLLPYVEGKAEVWVRADKQVSIRGGQTMWNFTVVVEKGARKSAVVNTQQPESGDLPF
jgi:hypothetical protein